MLKTSIILFTVVSVIFSTIYTPQALLPQLKQTFDLSMTQTNLLLSGMLFVLMIATPLYAPISMYVGQKKIMMTATFFLAVSVAASSLAHDFSSLLASRVAQGVFVPGVTAIMLSYVQRIYPEDQRGMGMGIYMAATGFGAVMGRLLSGWVTYLYSWRVAFGVFALLLVIALIAMGVGLPSDPPTHHPSRTEIRPSSLFSPKVFSVLLVPMVVFFSFMAMTTFVTYHLAGEPFYLNSAQMGTLFLVLLLSIVVSPLAGRYSDTIGRIWVLFMGVGLLLFGIVLTQIESYWWILAGIGFVTMGMFSVQAVAPAYLGDQVPTQRRSSAILYQFFFYLGGTLGTIIPVWAWSHAEFEGVALLCSAAVIIGITPLVWIVRRNYG